MTEHFFLTVKRANRLDKALVNLQPDLSRSAAQKLIEAGRVTVNGEVRDASHAVHPGDTLTVAPLETLPTKPQAEALAIDVLFEDEAILVINKPAGMVVHPGAGNMSGTLVNALLHAAPEVADVGDDARPGIVHRLDKETSGVILIAKTNLAHRQLQDAFKRRAVSKTYLALCIGDVQPGQGIIDKAIGRDPAHRQRMAIVANGRSSRTSFTVTERLRIDNAPYSLLRITPETGRTHQIRVHLASIGYPLVGDLLYGAKRDALSKRVAPRHMLHASELRFALPTTGEQRTFYAPIPADMRELLIQGQA
jgi:23S rRNA pseudouridine1911/1915/1917 synthase